MKLHTLALISTLGLVTGCAPQILQSNSSGGLIKMAGVTGKNAKSAKIADGECAKFGKLSKVTNIDLLSNTTTYDCVEK